MSLTSTFFAGIAGDFDLDDFLDSYSKELGISLLIVLIAFVLIICLNALIAFIGERFEFVGPRFSGVNVA